MLSAILAGVTALTLTAANDPPDKPLAEACPNLSAAERTEIEAVKSGKGPFPEKSPFPELAWYARDNCVTIAEAQRRMEIQNRDAIGAETEPGGPPPPPPNSVGSLSQRLEANEAATFAGLWIQHQPDYRVVVAFTRDAASTLAKYTNDPLFKPVDRPGASQAELRATQDRILQALHRFDARPSVGMSDIITGTVEISVTGDLSRFRRAVARGEVDLPAYVRIREPRPLPLPAPLLPADWRETVKAFPHAKYRSGGAEPDVLRTGTVVLEGGCLRLKGDRRSPVIVWPAEAALDLREGQVRVLNRASGERIAIDKRVRLGGSSGALEDAKDVVGTDPACPGPYFAIGNFGSMEQYDRSAFERRVQWLQRERKLSVEEAEREVRAEQQRQKQLAEIGKEIAGQAPDRFGGLWLNPDAGATLMWVGDKAAGLALIPETLRRYVTVQSVPRPIAELKAERDRLLDQIEASGIKAGVSENVMTGQLNLSTEDVAALSRGAVAGRIQVPRSAVVGTNGTGPDGYREDFYQAANRALEAAPDFAEVRQLVEATKLPSQLVTYGPGPDRAATRAQSLDITRFLIALGFTARDIRLLKARGTDPVRAWVMMNGLGGPEIRATIARDVAVGEVVDIVQERVGDGYRATVTLRLTETLKGARKAGETVRVRLVSGLDAKGALQQANDEPLVLPGLPGSLDQGSRWLLFLNEGFTGHHARMSGGKARPGDLISFWGLIGLDGERLDRRFAPDFWPQDLAGIRSALRPVDQAFDAANLAADGKLMTRVLE